MDSYSHPPEQIPAHLVYEYTMGNRIPVQSWYLDGTRSKNTAIVYTTSDIDSCLKKIRERETFYYGATDSWLYQALGKFPIQGKDVAVIGSETPIYESMVIYYGGKPTTIEYNQIISNDPRLTTLSVEEFNTHPQQFDAAFSISSFEHDGLGRYGDFLNPNGDLEAMSNMQSIIKDKGLFFLSVPVGPDTLVWNAQRIYGPLRLAKLLSDWKLLGIFPPMFPYTGRRGLLQPIFVLQNFRGDDIRLKRLIQKLIVVLACKRTINFVINNFPYLRNRLR